LFNKFLKLRPDEARTAWLMFAYSFLAMTSYNIIKPLTKSGFIERFGADNMPYVLLAAVMLIGVIMQMYSRLSVHMAARAIVPVTLSGLAGLLITFWLLFQTGAVWVSVAFYVFGLMFGILTISQFWTIANHIYDSRQARRLFGFIGGGASLGGAMGNGITRFLQDQIGENNLLLVSALVLGVCVAIVSTILRRQTVVAADLAAAVDERGVGGGEALRLLRESRHLQVIALVIGFAALAATIVDWQVNKSAEQSGGVSKFLAEVGFYLSLGSFVVQVGLTSVIHRSLGLAVALLVLPFGLGATAILILATGALWAPAAGSVYDRSLRYSLDKTTREVLFLPLPSDLKQRAKPFVDVTVDRLGKALGALLLLVLIKPWGLGLTWRQVSYASLVIMALWILGTFVARREYLRSFRRSLGSRDIEPSAVRINVADAATIETLVEELAHPDEASVLYAIDMLEMLDRRHLITPLLLHHDAPAVRTRALLALSSVRSDLAQRWMPGVHRMLKDPDANVRAAAVRALEALAGDEAPAQLHRFLEDADPRVAATAATVLADSPNAADPPVALAALSALVNDDRALAAAGRREAAAALAHISNPDFRALLVTLLHDPDVDVAREAIRSARATPGGDPRFVPALVSLLGHRVLKAPARAALISFGDGIVDALAYFLTDQHEHVWVRRHVPATLAALPGQASLTALVGALDDPDGFLRYKIIEAIAAIRRAQPALTLPPGVVDRLVIQETSRYYNYLTLRFNIVQRDSDGAQSLVVRALNDKLDRTLDRIYRLLGLIYPWQDIAAARHSRERGDAHTRARAIEYLDNLMTGVLRRRVMPIIDEIPLADKVRTANDVLRTRPRDLNDTLAQLVHEPDAVVAAAAIAFVRTRELWALEDDLKFVLAQADVDHAVADAATWALAAHKAGGAAERATGPLPIVELADRLRAIPLFDFVSVDEIFRIASTGVQVRFEAGHTVYEEGALAENVLFLTKGRVRLTGNGPGTDLVAPAALAFEDLLEGRPVQHTITALDPAVSLSLSSASLLTMMSDNIALARGFFRVLVQAGGTRPLCEVVQIPPAGSVMTSWRPPLEPVEKAGLLRQTPYLGRASVEQLLDLVAIAREVTIAAGATVFGETDAPAVYYVLDGEVVLERAESDSITVGPGAMIGMIDTLAGRPLQCTARMTRAGHALRMDQDLLFGVLADHVDLLQGLFSEVMQARGSRASRDRLP
jgi:AAA family ATP:ADP antiporter